MSKTTDFNYKEYLKNSLKPHPVGRPLTELVEDLPASANKDELRDVMDDLEERGAIKKIGTKWRWMEL